MNEVKKKLMDDMLEHHGILGQKLGVRNGGPYPLTNAARSAREQQLNGGKYLTSVKAIEAKRAKNSGSSGSGGGGSSDDDDEEWAKKFKDSINAKTSFKNQSEFEAHLKKIGIDPSKFSEAKLKSMYTRADRMVYAWNFTHKDSEKNGETGDSKKKSSGDSKKKTDEKSEKKESSKKSSGGSGKKSSGGSKSGSGSKSSKSSSNSETKYDIPTDQSVGKIKNKLDGSDKSALQTFLTDKKNASLLERLLKSPDKTKFTIQGKGSDTPKYYTVEQLKAVKNLIKTSKKNANKATITGFLKDKANASRIKKLLKKSDDTEFLVTVGSTIQYFTVGQLKKAKSVYDDEIEKTKYKRVSMMRLSEFDYRDPDFRKDLALYHHGIQGQKWGQRNGPPYPLSRGEKIKKYIADRVKNAAQEHEEKVKVRKAEREEDRLKRRAEKEEDRQEKRAAKKESAAKAAENKREAQVREKSLNQMNDEELIYMINRMSLENNFNRLLAEADRISKSKQNSNNNQQQNQNESSQTKISPEQRSFQKKIEEGTRYVSQISNNVKPSVETATSIVKLAKDIYELRDIDRKSKTLATNRQIEYLNAQKALNEILSK